LITWREEEDDTEGDVGDEPDKEQGQEHLWLL
jgi:hypothetical protein